MKTFKAAILTAHHAPLELVELGHEPTDHSGKTCAPGQVRCDVLMAGICGAQLGEINGTKNADAPVPRLLGHEGCGIIREVGIGVNTQLLGKKCVMHWRKGDGPFSYLPARYNYGSSKIGTLGGGDIVTFTESAVVSANRVTPVPDNVPDEVCALMGCSLSTALGTIEQEAKLRFGETVLIIGAGGVGANLILAACAAGAGHVTVVDKDDSKNKLAFACGANVFQSLTGIQGRRYDVIIDTTGSVEVLENTIPLLSGTGRYIMLGQTKPNESFRIIGAVNRFYGEGSRLIWSQGGGFKPTEMIPRYIALYRAGRLNLDAVVTHRVGLENVNKGFDLVRSGNAGRVLVMMLK